jgi:hypothetical protein
MSSNPGNGGSSSGRASASKDAATKGRPKFASTIRLRGPQERAASIHGRPGVNLKNARHGRHVIPFGLAERGVTNPFNTESQYEWGSRKWLKEKRGQLQQFILRVSVLGGNIEILKTGVEGAFKDYNIGRASKKSLNQYQDDLSKLAHTKVLLSRVLEAEEGSIDYRDELVKIAKFIGLPSCASNVAEVSEAASEVQQSKPDSSEAALSEEEDSFFANSNRFAEELGKDSGYRVNMRHIQALCESLTEVLLGYFNNGLPGITFHKHKPNVSVVKSRSELRLTKSETSYRYEQSTRPAAGEQIPLGRLDERYGILGSMDPELEGIRDEIASISTKLQLLTDSGETENQAKTQELSAQLDELKETRAKIMDKGLLHDMYLLFDYPKLNEGDTHKLASMAEEVREAVADEQDFMLQHFSKGFRSNDLGHLGLSIGRFIYFFFNAYPQVAIDFDWDVSKPLVARLEIESRMIAPFVKLIAVDWSLGFQEKQYLIKKVLSCFKGFATSNPSLEVKNEFDHARSSDSGQYTSDSDGESAEKQARASIFSANASQKSGLDDAGSPPGLAP